MPKPGLFGGQGDEYINPGDLDGTGAGDGIPANIPAPMPAPDTGNSASPPQHSSVWDDLLDAGEAIWTSPNTALGLIAGMAGILFGAKPTFEHGAVALQGIFSDAPSPMEKAADTYRQTGKGWWPRVRRWTIAAAMIGPLSFPAWSFEKVDGPRFFNATAHDIQLRATFANGDVFPVTLVPGALGGYWDAQQVIAVGVDEGNGHEINLSGPTLPKVAAGLSMPHDQIWLIDDSQVCVVPRRHFDRRTPAKC